MREGSHTWQEILSQPQVWRGTLEAFAERRRELERFLSQSDLSSVLIVGCGSTHYLAQSAAVLLSRRAGLLARALPSSELWLYRDAVPADRALLIAVSRSGVTTETVRAVERFRAAVGRPVLVITCYPESILAQEADFALVAPDGRERGVAQTRSFTSMLLLTQALAALLAREEGMLEHLYRLPNALEGLVSRLGDLSQRLGSDLDIERFFFLGGGPLYGLANEAMLKTKELSLSHAEAYHPLEFRHGPMSVVNRRTLVVGLLSDTGLMEEWRVLEEMSRLGARTLALVEDIPVSSRWRADQVVELHSGLDEWERGPLYLPVIQRLAYHRAVAKGLDPDRPNNLKPVVEL
ncbi:MAG TPA: SIS domain-containing protein [Anaerolineales bacterium]|nr:SIS domain-containing protein [Anaerolineae bacterium]HIQ02342.1 SIS domain-containing protein [Anaerolineales bacterium]